MASNACSSSREGNVCVGHIYRTKQELWNKLGLMALKNYFQFKVFKSYTTRFEAKCIVDSYKWWVCAIKNKDDVFFRVTCIKAMHTCLNKQLQYEHWQASSQLIGQLIKNKFKDASRIYTPNNIRDDIQNEYGVFLPYSKTWHNKKKVLRITCGDPALLLKRIP